MSKVQGEGASLNVRMGLFEELPPPIPATAHVSDVGGSSNHVLGEPISRVSVLESRVRPLHEACSQSISVTGSLRGVIQNMNDVTTRQMTGIQQRQNDLENSHQGMRSELEVAVGNLGALVTRVEKISLEEFFKRIPVSQVVGPTLDLLNQQVVEALSTYASKVQLILEEFSKAPKGIHSSVEEYLNQLRSSLCEELSHVFVDPVSDSISSFPHVSTTLSRLSKVETEVDMWKEWNPDE